MRSLRSRLFLAILGVVLLAVGASLALGIVLTRNAVDETLRKDAAQRAEFRPPPGVRPRPRRLASTSSAVTSGATSPRC